MQKGQLGHGDKITRDRPTVVSELSRHKIIRAGSGRSHTVVVTNEGQSFSFGWNKHGQLGAGSVKNGCSITSLPFPLAIAEFEESPVRCLVSDVKTTSCGADFTVWLTSIEGSSILTAGLPQYGQLGHGTDNEHNTKDSSVRLAYEAQPKPRAIAALAGETIVKVACGSNHTVAVDKNGFVYTWGFGGYGRLGHREQKDEWTPRRVDIFTRQNFLPPEAIVSAGSVNSSCTAGGGQLYMWGKIKNTGDDSMYPKPLMDLRSSAIPKKVEILEGMHVISVACGFAHSMVVVDRTDVGDKLDQLEVFDGKASEEGNALAPGLFNLVPENETPVPEKAPKKATKSAANSKKRKKAKDSSESEEEDDEEENSDYDSDDSEERPNGKPAGRGRGGSKGGNKSTRGKKGGTGRGRGRPPAATKSSASEKAKGSSGKRGRPRKSN
nr:protein RCC2 [Ipomoea trifida]